MNPFPEHHLLGIETLEASQITAVLDGSIGELVDALTTYYTAEKLKEVTAVDTGL